MKLRPAGEILLDMEPLIEELMMGHDLQHYDFLYLMKGYLDVHYPEHKETYLDGTTPEWYYGPKK